MLKFLIPFGTFGIKKQERVILHVLVGDLKSIHVVSSQNKPNNITEMKVQMKYISSNVTILTMNKTMDNIINK